MATNVLDVRRNIALFVLVWALYPGASVYADMLEVWTSEPAMANLEYSLELEKQSGDMFNLIPFDSKSILLHARLAKFLNNLPTFYILPADNLMFAEVLNIKPIDPFLLEEFPGLSLVSDNRGIEISPNSPVLLYYNKSLVKQAPASWQALIDFRAKDVLTINLPIDYLISPLWSAMGMYDTQGKVSDDFSDALMSSMREVKQLIEMGKIPASCIKEFCTGELFAKGVVPFAIAGEWEYGLLRNMLGDDLGVMAFPDYNGQPISVLNLPYVLSTTVSLPAKSVKSGLILAEFLKTKHADTRRPYDISPRVVVDSTWLVGCAFNILSYIKTDYYTGKFSDEALRQRLQRDFNQSHCEAIE